MPPARSRATQPTDAHRPPASLHWVCSDSSKTVASLAREELSRWARSQGIQIQQQTDLANRLLGLSIWACWNNAEVDSACISIAKMKEALPNVVQLVFLTEPLAEQASRMVQSGAHLVVLSLVNIPSSIRRIAPNLRLSDQDTNPLTQGLIQRSELL